MYKNILAKIAAIVALSVAFPLNVQALSASHFASESRLANGQWVKVAVSANGIHEITSAQLMEMGFNNPEKVAVYGHGGYMINEVLNDSAIDDLKPVRSMWLNDKLYFYAKATVEMNIQESARAGMVFNRTRNPYSQRGYYFLTEEEEPLRVSTATTSPSTTATPLTKSLNFWFHENELTSVSNSGKDLLGEDMKDITLRIPYHLPNMATSTIKVGARAASGSTSTTYLVGTLAHDGISQDVAFSVAEGKFTSTYQTEWFYDIIMPYSSVNLGSVSPDGELVLWISGNNVSVAKLDYAIITYDRSNSFASDDEGSFDMWFTSLKSSNVIKLTDVTPDVMVWNVTKGDNVTNYPLLQHDDAYLMTMARNVTNAHLVAFSPSRQQLTIDSFEPVANQNLHGMSVPEMLIVTCAPYMEQAKRIAQLHQEYDDMEVEVVDQQQVFNEFSSGTPDAMAIRLFCKKLYDSNSSKFKNLLIFGAGVFDNRGIVQFKENTVLTYESNDSRDKVSSYPSDDFYGMLDDGSGAEVESAQLRLGVGRIPSSTYQEAKSDVDKLVNYIANPDYGVWRNNYLIMADEGTITSPPEQADIGLHVWQAEGVNSLIEGATVGMHSNKVYVETFMRDPSETAVELKKRSCTDGRKHIIESLNAGQYFMTYVGHAGGSVMAGGSKLWRSSDVLSNNYEHLPIMTTACCNVARYDSNSKGVAEVMFHKPNGGVIALLTPARDVYAKYNDLLNRAFVTALFSTDNQGNMPTLGEAYKQSKLSFGQVANYNKMSFFLMGDPAIKINYPRPLVTISKVNGVTPNEEITISPMQQVTVEAQVMSKNGEIDRTFNGDATLTLYGSSSVFTSYTKPLESGVNETRDIKLERPMLAQVDGTVYNGYFTATFIVPRYAVDEGNLQLSVYAHKTGTTEMVNGVNNNLKLAEYDETTALTDNQAPVVEAMFINDETSFANNSTVSSDAMLYITATDDMGICMQKDTPGLSMRLNLDGNKAVYYTVKDYAVSTNQGRKIDIAFPLNGLAYGHHTLTFTVFDVAGNSSSRSIDFIVGQSSDIVLDLDEVPASTQATFNLASNSLSVIPQVDIKVTDAQGNLVWSTTTSQFPVVWDLKAADGSRVPAGLYKFFGTYRSGNYYGGTDIKNMIVINPL